jgi:hypothetical protein
MSPHIQNVGQKYCAKRNILHQELQKSTIDNRKSQIGFQPLLRPIFLEFFSITVSGYGLVLRRDEFFWLFLK